MNSRILARAASEIAVRNGMWLHAHLYTAQADVARSFGPNWLSSRRDAEDIAAINGVFANSKADTDHAVVTSPCGLPWQGARAAADRAVSSGGFGHSSAANAQAVSSRFYRPKSGCSVLILIDSGAIDCIHGTLKNKRTAKAHAVVDKAGAFTSVMSAIEDAASDSNKGLLSRPASVEYAQDMLEISCASKCESLAIDADAIAARSGSTYYMQRTAKAHAVLDIIDAANARISRREAAEIELRSGSWHKIILENAHAMFAKHKASMLSALRFASACDEIA